MYENWSISTIIFLMGLLYSPIVFVHMVIVYRVSKSIKECMPFIIQLIVIYVYCIIMIYMSIFNFEASQ